MKKYIAVKMGKSQTVALLVQVLQYHYFLVVSTFLRENFHAYAVVVIVHFKQVLGCRFGCVCVAFGIIASVNDCYLVISPPPTLHSTLPQFSPPHF